MNTLHYILQLSRAPTTSTSSDQCHFCLAKRSSCINNDILNQNMSNIIYMKCLDRPGAKIIKK